MRNALTIAGFEIATRLQADLDVGLLRGLPGARDVLDRRGRRRHQERRRFLRQRQGVDQLTLRDRADGLVPRHVRAVDHRGDHGPRRAAGLRVPRRAFLLHRADPASGNTCLDASSARSSCCWSSCRASPSAARSGLLLPGTRPRPHRPGAPAGLRPRRISRCCCPTSLVLGGLFFCLAALTRRMLPVYIGSVLLLIGFLAAQGLLRDIANKTLASLLDPFGVVATSQLTAYWSISERNTRLVPLEGCCSGTGCCGSAIGARRHRPHDMALPDGAGGHQRGTPARGRADRRTRRRRIAPCSCAAVDARRPVSGRPPAAPHWCGSTSARRSRTSISASSRFAGVLFLVVTSTTAGDIFGTSTWPVTWQMLDLLSGTFSVFMLVIITFYAGELAWRERETPAGPDPRRAADPDVAAVPGQAAGADAGAGGAAGGADAVRPCASRRPRATTTTSSACTSRACSASS